MNERTAPPPPPAEKPQKPTPPSPFVSPVKGRDREFLPAALEILETPPAPMPVALMMTICAFFAAALAWSFVGRLDVHAVAPGKIETINRAKIVQPFDSGKIAAIYVTNGQHVKAGDVLFDLDPAEAAADATAAQEARFESVAEIARRRYAVSVAAALSSSESQPGVERGLSARRSIAPSPRPRARSASTPKFPTTSACASAACSPPISTSSATSSPRSTSRLRRRRLRPSASA